ncbi:MAG: tRNA pseudouridine(55) synthase TruB [Candidatus Hydrogenedens sp.]|nr:tRNA pseudouridine(55) synthase TruB [Candidatus Hydrogenedens sp.]
MQLNGILLVDKPQGITSHDVVDALRKATGIRRIGHTGTLDPRATGLLVMCIGQATRLSQHLSGLDKSYEGALRLGLTTDSHDLDGKILEEKPVPGDLSLDAVQAVCNQFLGEIKQIPPMVSAIKIGGRRLYKIAREGQEIERPPRDVRIDRFDILDWETPEAVLSIACSSGAYVRTLCHDVGTILGCGGVLAQLRRTRVGQYSIEDALPLDQLDTREKVAAHLHPMDDALHLPVIVLDETQENFIKSGRVLSSEYLSLPEEIEAGWVQLKNSRQQLIALAELQKTPQGKRIQPKTVFV